MVCLRRLSAHATSTCEFKKPVRFYPDRADGDLSVWLVDVTPTTELSRWVRHKGRSVGISESQTLTMSALPLAQVTVIEVRSEDAIHLSVCYVLTTIYVG